MEVTNLYCILIFWSDKEKFDLSEFESNFEIMQKKGSWTIGDLQHPDYELSKRTDSKVLLKSEVSDDFDGTDVINNFFNYLSEKKEVILSLKEKYSAEMYFRIIQNLNSEDTPVVRLSKEQLSFLVEVEAPLDCIVYDYK